MILDGAWRDFAGLVMIGVTCARAAALNSIAQWVNEQAGLLVTTARVRDIELDPVPAFDTRSRLSRQPPKRNGGTIARNYHFRLSSKHSVLLSGFHAEHGWLHLAQDH